jgi:host factor-I protein
MEEGAAPNIQNEYFNQARREKRRLAVFLTTGRRITGRIRSFDRFTILMETAQGEQMIFKHAIATVGPVAAPAAGRGREGFGNRIEFDRARGGRKGRDGSGGPEEAGKPADAGEGGGRGEDSADS